MTTKTTTSLPLGWWRYRWPLLRAQIRARLRRLDIDPWLVLSGIVVAAIVVYGRTQTPAALAPALTTLAAPTVRPVVLIQTVMIAPTAAPTAIPTAVPPTAEPPPPLPEIDAVPVIQLAAPTVAPPTTEPPVDYPAWYTDIPTPAPWLLAACESEAGRQSWVCGGGGQEAGGTTP